MGSSQSSGRGSSRHHNATGHWNNSSVRAWQAITSYSMRKWHQKMCSLRWGFGEYINYSTFEYGDLVQPWSGQGRHLMAYVYVRTRDSFHPEIIVPYGATKKAKGKGDLMFIVEKPYKLDPIWYQVNLPPDYKLESLVTCTLDGQRYYTGVNVIGAKNDYIVVQITKRTKAVDIIITRKTQEDTLETIALYNYGTLSEPYFMEAKLSPSFTKLLLQPSAYYCVKFGIKLNTTTIQLIDFKANGTCRLMGPLLPISSNPPRSSTAVFRRSHVFAFDPRYDWKRIVIGYQYASVVRVCDLIERRTIVEHNAHGSLRQCTENLVYSPDGCFIASLVASVDSTWTKIQIWGVIVYETDSLTVVHHITYPSRLLVTPVYPACLFPLFSCNGQFLAVPNLREYSDNSFDVNLLSVPIPLNLQKLCRITILMCTRTKHIKNLPIPNRLKNYLNFKPYLD